MTPDGARAYLELCRESGVAAAVLYRPSCGHVEMGAITRVSGDWVFVQYGADVAAKATDPADLEFMGDMPTNMRTPRCPFCGEQPKFIVGITQAFCGNDDCDLLCWDPSLTLDANLMDARVARWKPTEGGSDG